MSMQCITYLQNVSFILALTEGHVCDRVYLRDIEVCSERDSLCFPLENLLSEMKLSQNGSHLVCHAFSFTYIYVATILE